MIYRVKQFVLAITARINDQDKEVLRTYLDKEEKLLFDQLRVYEQKHCIKVAKGIEDNYRGEEKEELIKVDLLHDIGKIKYPLNPIEKSVIVLLDKLTKGKIEAIENLKMVKCYYNHAEIGYTVLKDTGRYTEEFLSLVRAHHDTKEGTSPKLKILQACDNNA